VTRVVTLARCGQVWAGLGRFARRPVKRQKDSYKTVDGVVAMAIKADAEWNIMVDMLDVNHDGQLTEADVVLWRNLNFTSLP